MSQMEMFADIAKAELEILSTKDAWRDWDKGLWNEHLWTPKAVKRTAEQSQRKREKDARDALMAKWREAAKNFTYA